MLHFCRSPAAIYAITEPDDAIPYEQMATASATANGTAAAAAAASADAAAIPFVRNPAPHRGFNSKAREVLLDPPAKYGEFAHLFFMIRLGLRDHSRARDGDGRGGGG